MPDFTKWVRNTLTKWKRASSRLIGISMFGCFFGHDFKVVKKGSLIQTATSFISGVTHKNTAMGKILECTKCGKRKGEVVGPDGTDTLDPDYLEMIIDRSNK